MNKNIIKTIKSGFICTVTCFTLLILTISLSSSSFITAKAESRSGTIMGDFFNKVFYVTLTDGINIGETREDELNRLNINDSIYDGTVDKNYSLYDRFGPDVKFVPYFGEKKIETGLMDKFYSEFLNNSEDFELSADTIKKFFESPSISNNVVYENRPNILSSEALASGCIDPRVSAYSNLSTSGGNAMIGNFLLIISTFFTNIIGYLSGTSLFESINQVWVNICDAGLGDTLQNIVHFFLPIAIMIFIVTLISSSFKMLKGQLSGRQVGQNLLSISISLGIIYSLMYNPTAFSTVLTRAVGIVDEVLDSTIAYNEDEVVKSDYNKNIRKASIWKTTIFQPWCYGMFGDNYENLYTQFEENVDSSQKMEQSHDDVQTEWSDGVKKYNSANLTGDITVQVGPDKYIRNWAALAWSTQSIYHIDAVKNEDSDNNQEITNEESKKSGTSIWPKAETTPLNDQIYVDSFRWLDAKLNVSPEYHSTENVVMDYTDSKSYKENFVSAGFKSLYLTLMLIPIGILVMKKLTNALKIVVSSFVLCYQSLMSFVFPTKYNIGENFKKSFLKPLYDFLWWSIVLFLAITTYNNLMNRNLVVDLIWIIAGTWLCKFKPVRRPKQVQDYIDNTKNSIGRISRTTAKKGFEKIDRKVKKL